MSLVHQDGMVRKRFESGAGPGRMISHVSGMTLELLEHHMWISCEGLGAGSRFHALCATRCSVGRGFTSAVQL